MSDDNEPKTAAGFVERGVSMDQDGKSNVWAIEPKMEIENKSSEEKTGSALLAVGGFAVFAASLARVSGSLTNPPKKKPCGFCIGFMPCCGAGAGCAGAWGGGAGCGGI